MKNIAKRVCAAVVMTAVVLGVTIGTSVASNITYKAVKSDAPVVMTIGGSEVKADEYATYMLYNMKYYENMYAQYGLVGLWDDAESAAMMGASMPEAAKQQAIYTHVILQKFNEAGLKLDGARQKQLKTMKSDMIEQAAANQAMMQGVDASAIDGNQAYLDLIGQFGFNEQTYENFMYVSQCYSMLEDYYFGEGGAGAATDEELLAYFEENYLAAKHILILTIDPSTGEQKRTDDEAKAEAQKVLDRLAAGEDFDTVMNEVSEDSGLPGNPDGYIFTEGEMVQPFYDGAKALAEDEVSELVKSDFGYHIIKRVPVDYQGRLDDYRAALNTAMGKTMDNLLTQWMEETDVQTTETFDQITYENVYDYALVPKPAADVPADEPTDEPAAADQPAA